MRLCDSPLPSGGLECDWTVAAEEQFCTGDQCTPGECLQLEPVEDTRSSSRLSAVMHSGFTTLFLFSFFGGVATVDGVWGQWTEWAGCSRSCGYGEQLRVRYCDSPAPADGGSDCAGVDTEAMGCLLKECKDDPGQDAGTSAHYCYYCHYCHY